MIKLSSQVCGQIKCNVLSNDTSACNAGRLKADQWYEKLVSFLHGWMERNGERKQDSSRVAWFIFCHNKLVKGLMIYPCTVLAVKVFTAL